MNNTEIYIGKNTPVNKELLWLRPLNPGVSLYGNVNGKWEPLKLIDGKGTRTVEDDEIIDITGGGYSKEEIDERFADILGLDASGIAELKALIEDDDSLTGLLSEIAKIPKSIEDLSDGERVDNIEKALSEPLAEYNLSKNLSLSQDEDLMFYPRNPDKTVGEQNHFGWNFDGQTFIIPFSYVPFNNLGLMYCKAGTLEIKLVTLQYYTHTSNFKVYWSDNNSPQSLDDMTVIYTNTYGVVDNVVQVNTIIVNVPKDGYLYFSGMQCTSVSGHIALYAKLDDGKSLYNIGKQLYNIDKSLDEKVDKIEDKGLSTNDYTDVDKDKVDSLPQNYESKLTFTTSRNSSINAVSNTYCRFTSNPYSSITITLPTNPNVGDVCVFNFIANSTFSDVTWLNGTIKTMKDYTVEKSARNEVTALYDGSGYWLITNVSFTI